jgi:hypothetical protein
LEVAESFGSLLKSGAEIKFSKLLGQNQKEMVWSYSLNGESNEFKLSNDLKVSGQVEMDFIPGLMEDAQGKFGVMEMLDFKYKLLDSAQTTLMLHQSTVYESNLPDEMKGVILDMLQGDYAEQFIDDGYVVENTLSYQRQVARLDKIRTAVQQNAEYQAWGAVSDNITTLDATKEAIALGYLFKAQYKGIESLQTSFNKLESRRFLDSSSSLKFSMKLNARMDYLASQSTVKNIRDIYWNKGVENIDSRAGSSYKWIDKMASSKLVKAIPIVGHAFAFAEAGADVMSVPDNEKAGMAVGSLAASYIGAPLAMGAGAALLTLGVTNPVGLAVLGVIGAGAGLGLWEFSEIGGSSPSGHMKNAIKDFLSTKQEDTLEQKIWKETNWYPSPRWKM